MTTTSRDPLTEAIIGDAIAVHRELGPGLLESTYEICLAQLLTERGLHVQRQVLKPVVFRGKKLEAAFRLDLLVENRFVVELKSVARLEPVHFSQVMTQLKFSGCEIGLLINFNVSRLMEGVRRVIRSHKAPNVSPS